MGRRARAWLRGRRADDPVGFRVDAALAALLLALVLHLAFGDNPFEDGIAERLREGEPVRPADYAVTYGWWMALANAAVVALLLATRRRWLVRDRPPALPALAPPRRPSRAFVALVGGALALHALLGLPRLGHSLWGDEEYNVRRSIDGAYVRDAGSGALEFEEVRWRDTFFYYRKPNNHVPFSILARLSLGTWRAVARPEVRLANEAAVRLPAFLAGLASLAALALLLWRLGAPAAGVFAAWVLALHPWHLRYTTEARGYALLLALLSVVLVLWWEALHRGTWGRYAAFGVGLLAVLWTWPAAVVWVAVLGLATAAALVRLRGGPRAAPSQWTRLGIVTLLAALAWLQLMLPNVAQFAAYLGRVQGSVDARWLADVASHLLSGIAWGPDRAPYRELVEVARRAPAAFAGGVAATALLVAAGAIRLLRGGGARALLAAVLLLPPPLLVALAWWQDAWLYPWYLLFALPGLVALLALGMDALGALARPPLGAALASAAMAAWLLAFALATAPARAALRAGSLEPVRESVQLTRPSLDPFAPENDAVVTVSIDRREPSYYDPRVLVVQRPDELEALVARAEAEGKRLFVNYGRPELARTRVPELVAQVEDSGRFESVAVLRGFEPRGERHVLVYRGAGAQATSAADAASPP